jgi:hypothetical protein
VTRWLDVLPVALFVMTYLYLYASRVAGLSPAVTSALVLIFAIAAYVGRQFPNILNGSLIYAPTLALLLAVSLYHRANNKRGFHLLVAGSSAFLVALLFRTIDNAVCPVFPVETHFLWHLLTAAALGAATKTLIDNSQVRMSHAL